MKNLTRPSLLYLKAVLFVVAGTVAAALLIVQQPTITTAVLLGIAVWAFCRAYYFAFYVVERYVDPTHRFAGLFSFVRYLAGRRRASAADVVNTGRMADGDQVRRLEGMPQSSVGAATARARGRVGRGRGVLPRKS